MNQTTTPPEVGCSQGLGGTPGPYKATEFRQSDGSMCPGVMSTRTGSAVAWASGRSDVEAYENARAIATALNALEKAREARHAAL